MINYDYYFEIRQKVINFFDDYSGDYPKNTESFTKKHVYTSIGLKNSCPEFNKIWRFLTRERNNNQYLIADVDKKNHWIFLQ